jgi:hypothetical protein
MLFYCHYYQDLHAHICVFTVKENNTDILENNVVDIDDSHNSYTSGSYVDNYERNMGMDLSCLFKMVYYFYVLIFSLIVIFFNAAIIFIYSFIN